MPKRAKVTVDFVPTPREIKAMQAFANELAKKLQTYFKKERVVVAGSVAKGTFIRGSNDIDMFVVYRQEKTKDELEADILRAVKRAYPSARLQVSYAEHPYVKVFMGDYKLDVVPAFRFQKGKTLRSSVDRSLEHVRFIQKHTTQKTKREIVLLKKFLKAHGIYGAEIKVKGFSGYLAELLVVKYKTFENVLRQFTKKEVCYIDIKKYHKQAQVQDVLRKMNAPLVVIDPTDKDRNVAAALSKENLRKFIQGARAYLKKKDPKVFFKKPITFAERVKRTENGTVAVLKRSPINDDILWGQIHRLEDKLRVYLEERGFEKVLVFSDADELAIRLAIQVKEQRVQQHFWAPGPLISMPFHVENFKRANDGCAFKEERGRIWAWKKRKITDVREAILTFFKEEILPSHIFREACLL